MLAGQSNKAGSASTDSTELTEAHRRARACYYPRNTDMEGRMDEDADIDDFRVGSNDVVDAVERVESAVARVEQAVKDKWSSVKIIGWLLIGAFLWIVPREIWHAKWRYAIT